MDDVEIIDLFWKRSEKAIKETQLKYSSYCNAIAYGILNNHEDVMECVNDMLHSVWNSIPPNRPDCLKAFVGKITRNISLNIIKKRNTEKRGGGQAELVLSELEECIASDSNIEEELDRRQLTETINAYLGTLAVEDRNIFVNRYWYMLSIGAIARELNATESRIKSRLFRMRKGLKTYLEKEGIFL